MASSSDSSPPSSSFPLMPAVSAPLPSAPPPASTSTSSPVPVPVPVPTSTSAPAPASVSSTPTSTSTVRNPLVHSAVQFLVDPKVQTAPWTKRLAFLESKGLTPEEIQMAIETSKTVSSSSSSSSSSSPVPQSSTPTLPAPVPFPMHPPTYYPPPPPLPPPPPSVSSSFPFRNTLFNMLATAGMCYSMVSLVKKYVWPLLPSTLTPYVSFQQAKTEAEEAQRQREEAILDRLQKLIELQEFTNTQLSVLVTTSSQTIHPLLSEIQFDLKSVKGTLPIQLGPPKLPSWQTTVSPLSTSEMTLNKDMEEGGVLDEERSKLEDS